MKKLAVDKLTPEELRALDFRGQLDALNDLFGEQMVLAEALETATCNLAYAIKALLHDDSPERKAARIQAKCDLDVINIAIRTRGRQTKILQTLSRVTPN